MRPAPEPYGVTLLVLARRDDDGLYMRQAQLDLLLRSVKANWLEAQVRVIDDDAGDDFDARVRWELERCSTPFCAFATDDGAFYRRVRHGAVCAALNAAPRALCFSLRLGANTTHCYPTGNPQKWPGVEWRWPEHAGDFGYPGSVDAHVFRIVQLRRLVDEAYVPNPTALESTMQARCHELFDSRYPLMMSRARSSYVSVPVNRVSSQSGVRHGVTFPQDPAALNEHYRAGHRIDLRATFDDAMIDGAHAEVVYRWAA